MLLLATACTRQAEPAVERVDARTASPAQAAQPAGTATPVATAQDKQHAAERMQACRSRLEAAVLQQVVSNASVDNGRPILWVGPAWKTSTPGMQEKLVRDTACFFVSGDETKTIRFSVYDTATDRELSVWNHTHLVMP